jgi:hypothetical protein
MTSIAQGDNKLCVEYQYTVLMSLFETYLLIVFVNQHLLGIAVT